MQALINTIRATGRGHNIVVPEGLNWGSRPRRGPSLGYGLARTRPARSCINPTLYPNKLATASVLNSVLTVGQQYPIYAGERGDGGVDQRAGPQRGSLGPERPASPSWTRTNIAGRPGPSPRTSGKGTT